MSYHDRVTTRPRPPIEADLPRLVPVVIDPKPANGAITAAGVRFGAPRFTADEAGAPQ